MHIKNGEVNRQRCSCMAGLPDLRAAPTNCPAATSPVPASSTVWKSSLVATSPTKRQPQQEPFWYELLPVHILSYLAWLALSAAWKPGRRSGGGVCVAAATPLGCCMGSYAKSTSGEADCCWWSCCPAADDAAWSVLPRPPAKDAAGNSSALPPAASTVCCVCCPAVATCRALPMPPPAAAPPPPAAAADICPACRPTVYTAAAAKIIASVRSSCLLLLPALGADMLTSSWLGEGSLPTA